MWTAVAIVGIGLQLALLAAVGYLIRLVRHERAADRSFRQVVRRRTGRIVVRIDDPPSRRVDH